MTARREPYPIAGPGRVLSVVLERVGPELRVTVVLAPVAGSERITVSRRFASNVKFLGGRTELTEIVLLMAEDISDRGWEDARFQLRDYEGEFLSFSCREFDCEKTPRTGDEDD